MDRLSSDQAAARLSRASIAYVPIGSIEFHGPHLPLGVDLFTADGLCRRAAEHSGGVVLPPLYLACGCLDLPHSLTFEHDLVEQWTRAVVRQLQGHGVDVVIMVTGHGPLDLIHILKRVAREHDRPGARVYGLCYLELNAAMLDRPQEAEPTVIDHASTIETSWMMALQPELVHVDLLPNDPEVSPMGVYGKNPRFTASSELGEEQVTACAELLARRARLIAQDAWHDTGTDLDAFVRFVWPEPLAVECERHAEGLTCLVANPGRASRYISRITHLEIDGAPVDLSQAWVANVSEGESGGRVAVPDLHAERGIYVRRGQQLTLFVPGLTAAVGPMALELELGGVTLARVEGQVRGPTRSHSGHGA